MIIRPPDPEDPKPEEPAAPLDASVRVTLTKAEKARVAKHATRYGSQSALGRAAILRLLDELDAQPHG
jgi:hypothetical protein